MVSGNVVVGLSEARLTQKKCLPGSLKPWSPDDAPSYLSLEGEISNSE